MKLAYVAGRYRGATRDVVDLHIKSATMVGAIVAEKGYYPVIPHANTALFEHYIDQPDEFYLDGTLELMLRCDLVVMVSGWPKSTGAVGEMITAKREGIPVYLNVDDLPEAYT